MHATSKPTPAGGASAGIFARLTGPGPAAIALLRIAGPGVEGFLRRCARSHGPDWARWQPGDVRRVQVVDAAGRVVDDALVTVHAGPPDWVLHLHLHGSPAVVRQCEALLRSCGFAEREAAAASEAGFGLEMLEAEANRLLPAMLTWRGVEWLLAQPARLSAAVEVILEMNELAAARAACREMAERASIFQWFSRPARVVVAGPPNAGKSTLVNALADETVSIVSATPGTTRDWVDVPAQLQGFPLLWIDTAGVRQSDDALEALGIERTRSLVAEGGGVVAVLDLSEPLQKQVRAMATELGTLTPLAVALNKRDLAEKNMLAAGGLPDTWRGRTVPISAATGEGLELLAGRILDSMGRLSTMLDAPAGFAPRQVERLKTAAEAPNLTALRALLRTERR